MLKLNFIFNIWIMIAVVAVLGFIASWINGKLIKALYSNPYDMAMRATDLHAHTFGYALAFGAVCSAAVYLIVATDFEFWGFGIVCVVGIIYLIFLLRSIILFFKTLNITFLNVSIKDDIGNIFKSVLSTLLVYGLAVVFNSGFLYLYLSILFNYRYNFFDMSNFSLLIVALLSLFFILYKTIYFVIDKIIDGGKQNCIKELEREINEYLFIEKGLQMKINDFRSSANKYFNDQTDLIESGSVPDDEIDNLIRKINEYSDSETKLNATYQKVIAEKNKSIASLKEAYDLYETKNWKRRY